jgi:hypothetical protein
MNISFVEILESRRLLSAGAGRVVDAPGIAGSALPQPAVYVDVPFTASLAAFSGIDGASSSGKSPSVRINWGDGTPSTLISTAAVSEALQSGSYQASGTHAYVQIKVFRVTVALIEGNRIRSSVKLAIAVQTASAGGVTIHPTVNKTFSGVVGTFSGAGVISSADQSGVSIDWGDGQTSTGTVMDLGDQQYEVSGNHQYAIPAIHPIQLTASFTSSTGSGNQSIDSTAIVARPNGSASPPPIQGTAVLYPGPPGIVAGETGSGATISASFANAPYESAALSQYTATVKFTGMPVQTLDSSSFDRQFDDQGDLDMNINVGTFGRAGLYSATVKLYRDNLLVGRIGVPIRVTTNSVPSNIGADSPFGGTGVTLRPVAGVNFSKSVGDLEGDTFDGQPDMVSIDWGDGTTSAGSFQETGGGGELSPGDGSFVYQVTGEHTYDKPGHYRVRVFSGFAGLFSSGAVSPSLQVDSTAIVRAD